MCAGWGSQVKKGGQLFCWTEQLRAVSWASGHSSTLSCLRQAQVARSTQDGASKNPHGATSVELRFETLMGLECHTGQGRELEGGRQKV